MYIGIDVRTLETGHKFRGIGAYTKNLVDAISRIDNINQYTFFTQQNISNASKIVTGKNFKFKDYQIRKTNNPLLYNWYQDQIYFPYAIKKSKVQITHILDQLSCPYIKCTPTVITVHDLIQIGDLAQSNLKDKIKIHPVKWADKIIAISKSVKDNLIKYLHIPHEKISIVYNGYNHKIFKPQNSSPKKKKQFMQNLLGQKADKYLLYIGSFGHYEPRKNLSFLIEVLAKLRKLLPEEKIALVFVGKKGPETVRLKEMAKEKQIEKYLIFSGHVKHEDLAPYYDFAEMFLFPSIYEGFGLPPLEAMAVGCPVISSNTTSLPEVVGKGGILLDPENISEWVNSIKKILYLSNYRSKLIKSGFNQAKKFSWEKCARETINIYEKVSNQN